MCASTSVCVCMCVCVCVCVPHVCICRLVCIHPQARFNLVVRHFDLNGAGDVGPHVARVRALHVDRTIIVCL